MGSTRTVTLIANGVRHILACSTEPYALGMDAQLWGGAPYSVTTRRVAQIPGERVETVQAGARTIIVPVLIEGTTELEVDQRLGTLLAELSPVTDVRLVYTRPDGTERELTARYTGGGDAVSATSASGYLQRHVRVPLVFTAHFPFWRSTSAAPTTAGPTTFQDGRGAGINNAVWTNTGDVDVWPEFTVTGYVENVEVANLTTGQVWRVMEIIDTGDTLTIETDPARPGVYLNGALAWNIAGRQVLDPISELWPLVPGENVILFRGNTATGAELIGNLTARWHPLFESC
jgi:hypothetical protein